MSASRSATMAVAAAVVALAVGGATGLLGARALLEPDVPTDASVDAGFARDMQAHHGQAVEMAVMVREASQDEAVRTLALDILLTQQQQAGQMFGWLESWGLPQAGEEVMGWMGEAHGGGHDATAGDGTADAGVASMPGLATDEQMSRLDAAEGAEADRIFLALMIPHHEGGVAMAEAAVDAAGQPVVRRLAEAVIASQNVELRVLDEMLTDRGGPPPGL